MKQNALKMQRVQLTSRYVNWKTKFSEIMVKHLPMKKMRVRKNDAPHTLTLTVKQPFARKVSMQRRLVWTEAMRLGGK